jgi:chromosome segregation ATPase
MIIGDIIRAKLPRFWQNWYKYVSSKEHPIFKQWLTTGSIAFGVSCGCTLLFTQNLAQSALIGLATIPGISTSLVVRSRQRQQRLHRQMERGRLRLNELQQRGEILHRRLQIGGKDLEGIDLRVSQLHSLAANLNDRIDRDRDRHQQLELQLSALNIYIQEQQVFANTLDRKIQDKQACSLEMDINFNSLKVELSQLQTAQIQVINSSVNATASLEDQAKLDLKNIQSEIDRCLATKQGLEQQIQQLENRQQIESGSLDESFERQHLLLHELDLAINNRRKIQQNIEAEVDRLERVISEKSPELIIQEQRLADIRLQLSETASELQAKQSQLDDLAAEIINQNNAILQESDYAIELRDRELKIVQLELNSRKAELDNLELKVQAKLRQLDEIDLVESLQIFEPKPPIISRNIEPIVVVEEWSDKFIDNPHLAILQHIEKHGTITETEASSKLGNARSVRQFANKLEEYVQDLPFSIRVESSPKGNRYLKES